jgi:hypothetical protein
MTYTESFSEDEIFSSKEEAKKELDIYLKHKELKWSDCIDTAVKW